MRSATVDRDGNGDAIDLFHINDVELREFVFSILMMIEITFIVVSIGMGDCSKSMGLVSVTRIVPYSYVYSLYAANSDNNQNTITNG